MTTVKGDVHDIGKNIVAVVLQCNNFEVIDLGVMVPADKILKVAKEENCDAIGLSGLITPSLDEMVSVAAEMQRLDFHLPLLIGGATTSKAHTAVKIEPRYKNNPVIYVADASRAVGVMQKLVTEDAKAEIWAERKEEYEKIRVRMSNRKKTPMLSYEKAVENGVKLDWDNYVPTKPKKLGIHVVENFDLSKLIDFIDWTPFFISWELAGKYPKILTDEVVGEAATNLFNDAQAMLKRIIDEKLFTARGVVGLWPAQRRGADDVVVFNEDRTEEITILHHLRQQIDKPNDQPNYSLADYIAPEGTVDDYIGGFAVTSGLESETISAKYKEDFDDYNAILTKALGDRLAEAFAEYMHHYVRTELWGYKSDEALDNEDLIKEAYQGIRPAPGYPACPDHTEKETLFRILNATEHTEIQLTDNYAMFPTAAVSGWYFAHPESRYFAVGKLSKDQIEDYATRKGLSVEQTERWLRSYLDYD